VSRLFQLTGEYLWIVNEPLNNPVYHALLSGDQHLSLGTEKVKFFDSEVSPFAGFDTTYAAGFDDLYNLLPVGRNILYATPHFISEPAGWQLRHEVEGLQFVFDEEHHTNTGSIDLVPLQKEHVEEMTQLAALTKPGPFGLRTIEFGHYYGIFEEGRLAAMTGQRLHVHQFTEISAVCTHPDHLGKGYAFALIQHQLSLILGKGQRPFLHVRKDNLRAIELYKRIGFKIQSPMNFYFLKRRDTL
jgi:GNAT superfamily N-acetyltransferase